MLELHRFVSLQYAEVFPDKGKSHWLYLQKKAPGPYISDMNVLGGRWLPDAPNISLQPQELQHFSHLDFSSSLNKRARSKT